MFLSILGILRANWPALSGSAEQSSALSSLPKGSPPKPCRSAPDNVPAWFLPAGRKGYNMTKWYWKENKTNLK